MSKTLVLNTQKLKDQIDQLKTNQGNLSQLTTTAKDSLVNAINEVSAKSPSPGTFATKQELTDGLNGKVDKGNAVLLTGEQMIGGNKTFNNELKVGMNNLRIIPVENGHVKLAPVQDGKILYLGSSADNKYWNRFDLESRVLLTGIKNPVNNLDAVNKEYTDTKFSNCVKLSGNETIDGMKVFSEVTTFGAEYISKKSVNMGDKNYIAYFEGNNKTGEIGYTISNDKHLYINNLNTQSKIKLGNETDINGALTIKSVLSFSNGGESAKMAPSDNTSKRLLFRNTAIGNNCIFNLDLEGVSDLTGLKDPRNATDAVNLKYLNAEIAKLQPQDLSNYYNKNESDGRYVQLTTDQNIQGVKRFTGNLQLGADNNGFRFQVESGQLRLSPTTNNKWLKFGDPNFMGGKYFEGVDFDNRVSVIGIKAPTQNNHAANKEYVDTTVNQAVANKAETSELSRVETQVELNKTEVQNLKDTKLDTVDYNADKLQFQNTLDNKVDDGTVYLKAESYSRTEIDTKESTLEASLEQKANVNDVYNKGQSDSKYALINGDQTLGGNKTFTGITTLLNEQTYKKVTGRSANYFSFYQDNSRTAYLGHGSAANKDFTIATETENGSIVLNPHGTGVINVSNKRITNIANPTQNNDAINKQYFDNAMNSKADTNYVDTQINAKVVNVVSLNTEADINSMPDNTFGFYLRS